MLFSVRSSIPSTKNCSYFRIKNTYLFVATKFSDQGSTGTSRWAGASRTAGFDYSINTRRNAYWTTNKSTSNWKSYSGATRRVRCRSNTTNTAVICYNQGDYSLRAHYNTCTEKGGIPVHRPSPLFSFKSTTFLESSTNYFNELVDAKSEWTSDQKIWKQSLPCPVFLYLSVLLPWSGKQIRQE